MTRKPPSGSKAPFSQIEEGLGGLFGALGDAISEMVAKLEDGSSATVERNHTVDSAHGPVRIHAGVRLRPAGTAAKAASAGTPQPVNPNRSKPSSQNSTTVSESRPIGYDLFQDSNAWILTADLPGVARKDIQIDDDGTILRIRTAGARRYHADVALSEPFDADAIKITLRNGILTLTIPGKDSA